MDQSKIEHVVEHNIDRLKQMLELTDWDIKFTYGSCDGDPAMCNCDPDYQIAIITLDPVYIDNEKDVLHLLLHELIHCHTTMFGTYRQAVSRFLTEVEREAMDIVYRNAEERLACNFVRILERINKNENKKV